MELLRARSMVSRVLAPLLAPLWAPLLAGMLVGLSLALSGCGDASPAREAGPMRVVVSIGPLEGLIRPLLPPDAEITVLVEPGQSVHGYELPPDRVGALARADLVAIVGLGIESGMSRALRRAEGAAAVTMADAAGIEDVHAHHDHAHDHGHDHGADGVIDHTCSGDAHLWLIPEHAESFVEAAADVINTWALEHGVEWEARRPAQQLIERIRLVDLELRRDLEPLKGSTIITHHNSFTDFARRYGLRIAGVVRPIESLEPTAVELADLRERAREWGAQAVFVEPQFSPTAAVRLAQELDLPVGMLDPLGTPSGGDWFDLMEAIRDGLTSTLAPAAVVPGG
ncbi:MAG: metal ABC transporter substrate-binding protein [Planctomycetota bacterium]